MKWIEPKFSKESVKKAGKAIIEKDVDSLEFKEAIPILHNWRASHAFPMQIMLDLLRKNALCVDKNVLVVQRLKRVRSIFLKLNNEHNMSLSRMEDIGGCRAILAKTEDVYKVYRRLVKSNTKNILFRERDYIKNPKESGCCKFS
jgi:ppGpp synthetase/RelA/SpoT-type nucleotidyltranferase